MKSFNPEDFLVLIVDDVIKNIQVLAEMLDKIGYATTFATNGKEALLRVKTAKPDLILLDLMMPEMDGLQVCEHLKADAVHREIPIIFLTASHEQDHLLKAFAQGAADYVTKPFNPHELLARVRTHLEFKHTRDQLQKAQQKALEANRLKSLFIANMSHEIRTPMTAILGMTELLLDTPVNDQQIDFLQTLKSSGEQLLIIINDILDISKLEAGEMRLEPQEFYLQYLIDGLLSLFRPQIQAKNLTINYHIDPQIPLELIGDQFRLNQIMTNLIGNAIKFTDQGTISLKINLENQSKKHIKLRFFIKDTGIGITSEDQKKLFQSFFQADASSTRRYGGTGLGLAISKQLVELMGGEIGVKSLLNQGSTFWFTAVFERGQYYTSELIEQTETAISELETKANKLLLVEDNRVNQKVITQQLKSLGYEVDCVNNGQEALEIMDQISYRVVLMDCQMPILDGYKTTQIIREKEDEDAEQHTIIIGLTASAMKTDKEKCLAIGMDDYISKPASLKELKATLAKWC